MAYIIGFGIAIVGFLMVWKSDWLVENVGRVEWAETHFTGEGGSRLFYKLLGVLVILGGFLSITGGVQAIIRGIFNPLTNPDIK